MHVKWVGNVGGKSTYAKPKEMIVDRDANVVRERMWVRTAERDWDYYLIVGRITGLGQETLVRNGKKSIPLRKNS